MLRHDKFFNMPLNNTLLIALCIVAQATMALTAANAANSSCSSPIGAGAAGTDDPFWLESITHQVRKLINYEVSLFKS